MKPTLFKILERLALEPKVLDFVKTSYKEYIQKLNPSKKHYKFIMILDEDSALHVEEQANRLNIPKADVIRHLLQKDMRKSRNAK